MASMKWYLAALGNDYDSRTMQANGTYGYNQGGSEENEGQWGALDADRFAARWTKNWIQQN